MKVSDNDPRFRPGARSLFMKRSTRARNPGMINQLSSVSSQATFILRSRRVGLGRWTKLRMSETPRRECMFEIPWAFTMSTTSSPHSEAIILKRSLVERLKTESEGRIIDIWKIDQKNATKIRLPRVSKGLIASKVKVLFLSVAIFRS